MVEQGAELGGRRAPHGAEKPSAAARRSVVRDCAAGVVRMWMMVSRETEELVKEREERDVAPVARREKKLWEGVSPVEEMWRREGRELLGVSSSGQPTRPKKLMEKEARSGVAEGKMISARRSSGLPRP